jgi:hypothetical protein
MLALLLKGCSDSEQDARVGSSRYSIPKWSCTTATSVVAAVTADRCLFFFVFTLLVSFVVCYCCRHHLYPRQWAESRAARCSVYRRSCTHTTLPTTDLNFGCERYCATCQTTCFCFSKRISVRSMNPLFYESTYHAFVYHTIVVMLCHIKTMKTV